MSCSNATLHQPGTTVHQLFTQDFEQCLTNIKPQEIVIFVFDEVSHALLSTVYCLTLSLTMTLRSETYPMVVCYWAISHSHIK